VSTVIHLTFDDGPHETFTPAVLDVLDRHDAKATFFQEGRYVERYPELTERAIREGHAVGNHTWSHPNLTDLPAASIREELASTSDVIARVGTKRPTLFRPPYGKPFIQNPDGAKAHEIRAEAADLGMTTHIWDIWTFDYDKPGRTAIAKSVVDAPDVLAGKSGLRVLLHDGECADEVENLAALEVILKMLTAGGFVFTPLGIPASSSSTLLPR